MNCTEPKELKYDSGFIVTEDDIFSVSSFTCDNKARVGFYISCEEKDRLYIKSELLNRQSSLVFIGPKFGIPVNNYRHALLGFKSIHAMRFIDGRDGFMTLFVHDSDKRFLYDEHREYLLLKYVRW